MLNGDKRSGQNLARFCRNWLKENRASVPGWATLIFEKTIAKSKLLETLLNELVLTHGPEDRRTYEKICHYFPRRVSDELSESVESLAAKISELERSVEVLPPVQSVLLETLNKLEDGSIAVIYGVQQFGEEFHSDAEGKSTWAGTKLRVLFRDERNTVPICTLCEKLVEIARAKRLTIVAVVEASSFGASYLSASLNSLDGLAILGLSSEADRIEKLCAKMVERIRKKKLTIESAIRRLSVAIKDERTLLQAKGIVLQSVGLFGQAWEAYRSGMEPHVASDFSTCMGMANLAFAAFDANAARSLLRNALDANPETQADLEAAWSLAKEMKDEQLSNRCFDLLSKHFPTSKFVLSELTRKAAEMLDFVQASRHALLNGDDFAGAVFAELSKPQCDVDEFLRQHEDINKRGFIQFWAAIVAENKGALESARYWAKEVPEAHHLQERALICRIRVFFSGLRSENDSDGDLAEFETIIRRIVEHPEFTDARITLFAIYEEPENTEACFPCAVILVSRLAAAVTVRAAECPRFCVCERTGEDEDPRILVEFYQRVLELNSPLLVTGRCQLDEELSRMATAKMLRSFCILNDVSPGDLSSTREAVSRTMVMEAICRNLNEPSLDLVAACLYVRRFSQYGRVQLARDFAEEIFQSMIRTQPSVQMWRIGLSWMCFGEAQCGSGNARSALLSANMMMLAWQQQTVQSEEVCDGLNLIARIFRELKLPFSAEYIEYETSLRKVSESQSSSWAQESMEIDLRIQFSQTRTDYLKRIVELLKMWRALPDDVDPLPVTSRLVSIIRHVRHTWYDLRSTAFCAELKDCLLAEDRPISRILTILLEGLLTREDLLKAVESFDHALRFNDLRHQIRNLRLIAEEGLVVAQENNDIDLYISSFALLAQPSFSVASGHANDESDLTERLLRSSREQIQISSDPEFVKDLSKIVAQAGRPKLKSIAETLRFGMDELRAVLSEKEVLLLVAITPNWKIGCCFIMRNGFSLWSFGEESWERSTPGSDRGGSEIVLILRSILEASAESEVIINTFDRFGLILPFRPERITVVPSADLFAFPFGLLPVSSGALVVEEDAPVLLQDYEFSIAPSPLWLIKRRSLGPNKGVERRAWLGSSISKDPALCDLRFVAEPLLKVNNFSLVSSDGIPSMQGSQVALVALHGSSIVSAALTDGSRIYSFDDVAKSVSGSTCVVLVTCHGAESSPIRESAEVYGLVSSILMEDVGCVIASHWVLNIQDTFRWLSCFLNHCNSGLDVAASGSLSNKQFKGSGGPGASRPLMNIYGDGNVILPAIQGEES